LTTAQAVVFSTSAAVPLRRSKATHWLAGATRVVATSMRRIFLTPTRGAPRARKRYPSQCVYLERAATDGAPTICSAKIVGQHQLVRAVAARTASTTQLDGRAGRNDLRL
jgi:hypothetical protein